MGGIVSPIKNPQARRDSVRSRTSLRMAMSGMERNIPCITHKAAPEITPMIETRALSFTFEPITLGTMKLLSINWIRI